MVQNLHLYHIFMVNHHNAVQTTIKKDAPNTLITLVNDILNTLSRYNILGDYVDMHFLFKLSVELITSLMIYDPPFFFLVIFQILKDDISWYKSRVFVNLWLYVNLILSVALILHLLSFLQLCLWKIAMF